MSYPHGALRRQAPPCSPRRPNFCDIARAPRLPEPPEGAPSPCLRHLSSTRTRHAAPHRARRRRRRSSDVRRHVICGRLLLARGTDAHLPTAWRGLYQDRWHIKVVLAPMPDKPCARALLPCGARGHTLVEGGGQGCTEGWHRRGRSPERCHTVGGRRVGLVTRGPWPSTHSYALCSGRFPSPRMPCAPRARRIMIRVHLGFH